MTDVWDVIVPAAGVNYVANPSAELSASHGWSATDGSLSRAVGGVRGAYAFTLTASAQNGNAEGVVNTTFTLGVAYVASAWVRADSASVQLRVHWSGSNAVTASHPGDGEWHRLSVASTVPSAVFTPSIQVRDTRSSAWTQIAFDAVQFETGVTEATTYIDGDQEGCAWDSGAHQSISRRAGRDGRGGEIVSFDSLGLDVRTFSGIGAPRMDVATTAPAFADGAFYQRSLAKSRVVLMNALIRSTGIADLHATRRAALDALGPDIRQNRGPIVLRYRGADEDDPRLIQAYYEAGFDFADVGPHHEMLALRYLAPDPYWYAETDTQASLTPYDTLANVNGIAQRGADGVWSNMASGINGTTDDLRALTLGLDGTLYAGGDWTGGFGVSSSYFAKWDGSAWSQVAAVNPDGLVSALVAAPSGLIYLAGNFTTIGGVSRNKVASFDPAAGTYASLGTTPAALDTPNGMAFDGDGNLWLVGQSTSSGSTFAYSWNGSGWTDRGTNGTVTGNQFWDVALGPDRLMYAASDEGVYYWTGSAWSSIGATGGSAVRKLAWGPDNRLYAGGVFTTIGGVSASGVARWNGTVWEPLGSGVSAASVLAMGFLTTGELLIGGSFSTAGGLTCADSLAVWNGSSWRPYDVNLPGTLGTAETRAILAHPNGAVTVGRPTNGSAIVPAITTVTNAGTAPAYPVFQIVFANNFQAPISIANLTTGQRIDVTPNLYISGGETATLDLRPGRKTFRTQTRNLISLILPGSDLDNFLLVPGENRIACFVESSGVVANLFYRARYLSAD